MTEPERAVSKTQLEAWRSCERKWGWPYLDDIRKTGVHRELGIAVHRELELWLREGKLPSKTEAGLIAESSLHLLPHPSTRPLVEIELFTITNTAIYHGFADWVEPPDAVDKLVVIGDHKSTGDFKWAMEPQHLDEDIQANIYARAMMDYFRVDVVTARWNYLRTRGAKKTHPVQRELYRARVEQVFAETIDPLAAQIHEARKLHLPVLELRPNYKACDDYGGCDYRENCGTTARERFVSLMTTPSNLAEKMKAQAEAKKAAAAAGGEQLAEPPKTAAVNPPSTGAGLASKMAGLKKPAETPPATPPPKQPDLPHVAPATAPVAPEIPQPSPISGVVLCVGCFPTQGAQVLLATKYIDQAKRLIETESGLRDYRLADFNKGPGMLCAATRQMLADDPPASGTMIFLDNRTDEGRHALEAFREIADVVVRGF